MNQYVVDVDRELEKAAVVDGKNLFKATVKTKDGSRVYDIIFPKAEGKELRVFGYRKQPNDIDFLIGMHNKNESGGVLDFYKVNVRTLRDWNDYLLSLEICQDISPEAHADVYRARVNINFGIVEFLKAEIATAEKLLKKNELSEKVRDQVQTTLGSYQKGLGKTLDSLKPAWPKDVAYRESNASAAASHVLSSGPA